MVRGTVTWMKVTLGKSALQRGHGVAVPREEGVDIRVAGRCRARQNFISATSTCRAISTAHGAVEVLRV